MAHTPAMESGEGTKNIHRSYLLNLIGKSTHSSIESFGSHTNNCFYPFSIYMFLTFIKWAESTDVHYSLAGVFKKSRKFLR